MCIQAGNNEEICKILDVFLGSTNVTMEFIVNSCGKIVKKLRGSEDEFVRKKAIELTIQWKMLVRASMSKPVVVKVVNNVTSTTKPGQKNEADDMKLTVEEINGEGKVLFFARGNNRWLSNLKTCKFSAIGIDGKEKIFTSSEHMYVSMRFPVEYVNLFSVDGPFASFDNLEEDFKKKYFTPPADAPKKDSWKSSCGIIVKKLVGRSKWAVAVRSLYKLPTPQYESQDSALWHKILHAKFSVVGSPQHEFLRKTGTRQLIEFEKSALQEKNIANDGKDVIWGGAFDKNNKSGRGAGVLIGRNLMGGFISDTRTILFG